jgi:UDP-N-acetylmuramate dehydrogenase
MLYFKNMESKLERGRTLAEFSTFGIGGPVSFVLFAKEVADVVWAYQFAKSNNLPVLIIGKGSNTLFSDAPQHALALICKLDRCNIEEEAVTVGAGYSFSLLGVQTARKGLSGLEFASGIPATVGGAVYMNAGANGQETKDCLQSVEYLHESGQIVTLDLQDLKFSYRFSSFQTMKGCILGAKFQLQRNAEARPKQLQIIDYRLKTQPYREKSAGCVFRNPGNGISAGALIEKCGLKGCSIGGAKVSDMHANFIVNASHASAQDVRRLIQEIQEKVSKQTGIHLEPEIRFF